MFTFFLTILPLLFLIALGFGAGRAYKLDTAQFGSFVAFTIAPLVTFGAILNLDFNMEVAMLPVAVLVISFSASMIALSLGRRLLPDTLPNLAAMAAGNANTGFFGLPVFLLFMPINMTGIYLLGNLGIIFVETMVGYYLGARGQNTVAESLKKVAKLPPLWATILALICKYFGLTLGDIAFDYWEKILHTWIISGMIMIGIALASCETLRPDVRFCSFVIFIRNCIWPLLVMLIIWLDYNSVQIFDHTIYFVLVIFAISPMAGNTVAFAATLNLYPGKIAFAVVISTILTTLTMPLYIDPLFAFIMSL